MKLGSSKPSQEKVNTNPCEEKMNEEGKSESGGKCKIPRKIGLGKNSRANLLERWAKKLVFDHFKIHTEKKVPPNKDECQCLKEKNFKILFTRIGLELLYFF